MIPYIWKSFFPLRLSSEPWDIPTLKINNKQINGEIIKSLITKLTKEKKKAVVTDQKKKGKGFTFGTGVGPKDILVFCGLSYLKLPNERILFYYESKKTVSKSQNIKLKKIDVKLKPKNAKILKKNKKSVDPDSPFAVLEKLL